MCYIDLGSFIIYIKTKKFYKDIAKDVKGWFDISNYKVERTLPIGSNEKDMGSITDELWGKIMK